MADPQTIHQARKNGVKSRIFGDPISIDQVVSLLDASTQEGRRNMPLKINANRLIHLMAEAEWRIVAGPHKGGFGGEDGKKDETWHITLRSKKKDGDFHLRQNANGQIFKITGPGMVPNEPSQAPGAGPGEMGRGGKS